MSTVEKTRKCFTDERSSVNSVATETHLSPGQQLTASIRRVRERIGLKNMPAHFDGRDGQDVAISTINRWEHDPKRFSVDNLPVLIELDPELGRYFLKAIPTWMGLDQRLMAQLDPTTRKKVREAHERLVVEEIGPGRWGVR